MSRKYRQVFEAKRAPVELAGEAPEDDDYDDADGLCPHCDGDGRDPCADFLLPCPYCQAEQQPAIFPQQGQQQEQTR